ncbi:MAG: MFS transporter [Chloroflexi bacterium]|nr:MFS transporter [Chloroflexota bacterium]
MSVASGAQQPATEQDFTPLPRRTLILTMAGVMLAMFLGSLDQTVVGTAMPRIIADLGGFSRYTWVGISYMVASTTLVPVVGRLTDMYGRKWFFIGGLTIFLLGSALAGLSQTMNQLIAFRGIQGIGGGVIMAVAFVAIGDLFPAAERAKWQGLMGAMFGLSAVIGPTLGGFITDTLSWHWVFYINLPLGVPAIALFFRFFPDIRPTGRGHHIDYAGVVALVLAVVPILLGLSWGNVLYPWTSPQVLGMLAFGGAMTAVFLFIESRAKEPIIPLDLFRNPIVSVSIASVFFTSLGMFGAIAFVPLFFQAVLGSSATASGSFLTPMMLGVVVSGIVSGQILSRFGGHYRIMGLVGLGIMGMGIFLLSRMGAETSHGQAVFNIVLTGLGLGVTFPCFTIAVQNAVPYRVMGVATSSVQFFRSIGGTMGLAVFGSVMAARFQSHLMAAVSSGLKEAMPAGRLEQLAQNPNALMSPGALASLQGQFSQMGPQGTEMGAQLLTALRSSLGAAIGDIFFIALIGATLAFAATIFLKEIPLQKRRPQAAAAREPAAMAGGENGKGK